MVLTSSSSPVHAGLLLAAAQDTSSSHAGLSTSSSHAVLLLAAALGTLLVTSVVKIHWARSRSSLEGVGGRKRCDSRSKSGTQRVSTAEPVGEWEEEEEEEETHGVETRAGTQVWVDGELGEII